MHPRVTDFRRLTQHPGIDSPLPIVETPIRQAGGLAQRTPWSANLGSGLLRGQDLPQELLHSGTAACARRFTVARLPMVARPAERIGPSSAPPQRTADPLRTLARRAAEGEGEAIHALVTEVGGPMLRTVRKVLGARHPDAEDVTQEAVLGLLAALERFRGDCTVMHYAHQVALRSALHARRHFSVRARVGDPTLETEEPVDLSGKSPLEVAVSRQRRRIIRSLLERLPEPTAEALALHFMLGYTVDEIATIVEVSPNTVWSRLKLGKRALRQALTRDRRLSELLQGKGS